MGSERLKQRPVSVFLRRARRRVVCLRWGLALCLGAVMVAGIFWAKGPLPLGPLPIYFLVAGVNGLLAPRERRLEWLAHARGELSAPTTRYSEPMLEVALRDARRRRLLQIFMGITSVVLLLLMLRQRQFADLGHVLVPLALVLLALWRTVLDIRHLESGRWSSPRRRAMRRLFS